MLHDSLSEPTPGFIQKLGGLEVDIIIQARPAR